MDNEAKVRIVGDASGVRPATEEAKAQVKSLGAVTEEASAQMREAFAGVSVSVREMGVQIRESFEAVGEFREMLMGVGEAMLAAFAVERIGEWAKEIAEAGEKVEHTAMTFGMATTDVQ